MAVLLFHALKEPVSHAERGSFKARNRLFRKVKLALLQLNACSVAEKDYICKPLMPAFLAGGVACNEY